MFLLSRLLFGVVRWCGGARPRPRPPLKCWARSFLVWWWFGSGFAFSRPKRPGRAPLVTHRPSVIHRPGYALRSPSPLPSRAVPSVPPPCPPVRLPPLRRGAVATVTACPTLQHLTQGLSPPCPPLPLLWFLRWWPTAKRPTTTAKTTFLCASSCFGSRPLRSGAYRSPSPYQWLRPSQRLPPPLRPSQPIPHPLPQPPRTPRGGKATQAAGLPDTL